MKPAFCRTRWPRLKPCRGYKANARLGFWNHAKRRTRVENWPTSNWDGGAGRAAHGGCGKLGPMRVFGIDCGTETTGFGVVESDDTGGQPRLVLKAMGAIRLKKTQRTAERLEQVSGS